jgi:hypothetical protein
MYRDEQTMHSFVKAKGKVIPVEAVGALRAARG